MDLQAADEAPPVRPFNWTWALIVAVWLLLFMIVLAVGAAVVFWRQATSAKHAVAAITDAYQTLNEQLTASDAKVATLTKDRSALVDQLAASTKQLAAAKNQPPAPNADLAKLTAERNALADQLTNTNADLANLTTTRDDLAQRLATAQARQIAAANRAAPPVPLPPPAPPIPAAPAQPAPANVPPAKPIVIPPTKPPVPTIPQIPVPTFAATQASLTREFSALLATDPNPSELVEAAKLFDESDRLGRSVDFGKALPIIRMHRSNAAIPLLLKYLVKADQYDPNNAPRYADAFTILTGEDADINAPLEWWLKNKPTLTADLSKMSAEQLRRIAAALTRGDSDHYRYERRGNAVEVYDNINSCMTNAAYPFERNGYTRAGFFLADLCPALLPPLLEQAGWIKDTKAAAPPNPPAEFHYEIVPLLAILRKDGRAAGLEKLAADDKQPASLRLTCLLALRAAGENINSPIPGAIAEQEKSFELRLVSIVTMQYTPSRTAADKLIKFLDDPNDQIIAAAAWGIQGNPVNDAVPGLSRALNKFNVHEDLVPIFIALKKIHSHDSADALAGFMVNQLKNSPGDSNIIEALRNFYDITACPHRRGQYTNQDAIDACNWWHANKDKG